MKYTYQTIQGNAERCKKTVEKEYKTGIADDWTYYFAKLIINPKKDVTKINMKPASNKQQDSISRGISKKDYTDIAKRYVAYVEKHKQIPNYVEYKGLRLSPALLKAFFAKCLVNNYPSTQNINSKWFTKPTETGNAVYDYACKKYGKKFKTLDEILTYVLNHFKYEYYYDDHKSNKQVTDSKSGNCTDLLQWLSNMVEPLGYEWKCIHVQCRSSGSGHVFGKFRHKKYTENSWITRDIACVANGNGGIKCVWCSDGHVLGTNPSWWMQNRNR